MFLSSIKTADESTLDHEEINSILTKQKLRFNLEFGTSFSANKYGSYFGTYVSPRISYPVSNRFTLSFGGYFAGISPISNSENSLTYGSPYGSFLTRSYVYVEGAYRLTENLTVSGVAYKEVNLFRPTNPGMPGNNFDSHGFIMGVDYKIGNNVFIRGQVEVSNGNSPYRYSPFMNPAGSRLNDPFFTGH